MIIISQNKFLTLGILLFCLFRGTIKIKGIIKEEYTYKKIYSNEEFIFDLFCIYLIGVASKVYFPLTIAWGNNLIYNPPEIWLSPLWSIKQIYHEGGLRDVIYQLIGNSIMLSPMAFFLCYFYSIDEEKLTLGKGIIDKILESFELQNKNKLKEDSYIPSLSTVLKFCFFMSLFVESSQVILSLVFPNTKRFFEVNDLMCNTLSGVWGYYIYIKIAKLNIIPRKIFKL